MNLEDLFVENNLPQPLSKDELYECFLKYEEGDIIAKEKIVKHNIRFVINRVLTVFTNIDYDKKELICVGIEGLIKAVNTFDLEKSSAFLAYAATCIDNQIKMYLRKMKKHSKTCSLEQTICTDSDGNELRLYDIIDDEKIDLVSKYEKMEERNIIRKIVENLDAKEKEIIKLHFGFYDRVYTQDEVSKLMGLSQSYISRIISKILLKIRKKYSKELCDLYQTKTNSKVKSLKK